MMPVPPSLSVTTTVLSWGNGLASVFSDAVTPINCAARPVMVPVGAEVELAQDVALVGVGPGDDVGDLEAGSAALLAVQVDAGGGPDLVARVRAAGRRVEIQRRHRRQVRGAEAVEGERARGRARRLRGGIP